jgi:hypothetical protein
MKQPVICSSVTRPVDPPEGMLIWEVDTDKLYLRDQSQWRGVI